MINTEEFISETYWFLQEHKYIHKSPNSSYKENKLLNKLEKMHNCGALSDSDYHDLKKLCLDALFADEISGFLAGIYLTKIINMLL